MFYKFTLDLDKLQDDTILPKTREAGVLFYEIVVKNGEGKALLRIPFRDQGDPGEWKIELYDQDTEINPNRVQLSMHPHIARFDRDKPLTFHAAKVTEDVDAREGPHVDRIGYQTHVEEGSSEVQDLPFFCLKAAKSRVPSFIKNFQVFTETKKMKKIDELPLHEYGFGSQYWLTQRNFYSTSHTTLADHVHRENIQVLRDKFFIPYKDYEFKSVLFMLIRLSKAVTKGRIKYKADRMFAKNGVSGDAGNVSIETSSRGDCEDMGHFYMRVIRTMIGVYKFFVDEKSDLYKKCKILEDNYVCFNFICQVLLDHGPEFHSTMIIIPTSIKWPVLSFEVTNPRKSYELPCNEYHAWHKEQYFLVDNYFLSKINKTPIENIELGALKFMNY